jgi:hypothetical protein
MAKNFEIQNTFLFINLEAKMIPMTNINKQQQEPQKTMIMNIYMPVFIHQDSRKICVRIDHYIYL